MRSQLHVPDLPAFSRVDDLTGEHIFDVLCDGLVLSDLVQECEALSVDLGVGVVEPNLVVEGLEPESGVTGLVLKKLTKVRLARHRLVVSFKGLDGRRLIKSGCLNHDVCAVKI